jgi:uncharacterized protein YqfA (UPF0365 family)
MNIPIALTLGQITGIVGLVFLLILLFIIGSFLSVWLKAFSSGAPVSMWNLVAMRYLRKLPYSVIVDARIMAVKAGLPLTVNEFETHYMAGGDIIQTVSGLINAQKAGIPLDWDQACAIDLATKGTEKSIIQAVRTSINPMVIDCPNPSSGKNTKGRHPGEGPGTGHGTLQFGALRGECTGGNDHCPCR